MNFLTGRIKISVRFLIVLLLVLSVTVKDSYPQTALKIAICQIFVLDGDRSGNFVRIENAMIEAKNAGADIACFPETAVLGWVNPDAHKRACPIPGDDTKRLSELARKYDTYLCLGLCEKDGENLYDSVVLIDNKGNILLKHRKINILSELMTPAYTPGEGVNIVQTVFGRIGLLICADTFKDDIIGKMAELKPDLVLVPYGWAAPENAWPEHGKSLASFVKNLAVKVGAPVIGTDVVGEITKGPWSGQVYGGQSVAFDAAGNILAAAKDRDRDIVIVSIPKF
ncbi:carbon-nitrogen hydrolase family protein [candidate division KSB1 bacterium]